MSQTQLADVGTIDPKEWFQADDPDKEVNLIQNYAEDGIRILDYLRTEGVQQALENYTPEVVEKIGMWNMGAVLYTESTINQATVIFTYMKVLKPLVPLTGQMWASNVVFDLIANNLPVVVGIEWRGHYPLIELCNETEFFFATYFSESGTLQ